jgi:hypothetical protein
MMEKCNVVTPKRTPKAERRTDDWAKTAASEFKPAKSEKAKPKKD